jgi:uncharacterized protein YndB with AHSA1/START domain
MTNVDELLAKFHLDETIEIDAPVDRVWSVIADVSRIGEFSPECHTAEWIEGATRPDIGARFVGSNRLGEREWDRACTITELETEHTFAYTVGDGIDGSPATEWRFELEPHGEATTVRQKFHHLPGGRSGVATMAHEQPDNAAAIVEGRRQMLKSGMQATLAAMKAAIEGTTS